MYFLPFEKFQHQRPTQMKMFFLVFLTHFWGIFLMMFKNIKLKIAFMSVSYLFFCVKQKQMKKKTQFEKEDIYDVEKTLEIHKVP